MVLVLRANHFPADRHSSPRSFVLIITNTTTLLLLSYLDGDAFRDGKASAPVREMIEAARAVGEPFVTGFDPPILREELAAARFDLVEDVDTREQDRRYFSGRTDGYHATEHVHFACATLSAV